LENEGVSVLKAMVDGDRDALDALVADDVVFNGPASAYRGREQVVEVLAIGGGVLQGLTATREPASIGTGETLTRIEASVEGEQLDGVLLERTDEAGRVAEVTILLRPLGPLQTAIRYIARGMAEAGGTGA
jgi:SnoaL-like protein